jgi:hypothetical protein
MTTTSHTILCGSCKCAVQSVPNPKAHDKVTCPRCNRSDRFDAVMRVVKEHVTHSTARALHEGMAKAVRGSKFLKLTSNGPGYRSFRWIASGYGS